VGVIGIGMGFAGLITARPVRRPCTLTTDPFTPARAEYVAADRTAISEFLPIISPAYNIGDLFNGTTDAPDLGLKNQPGEFVRSVGGFLNGPRNPAPAPRAAP
jgi:hypothetical protein